MTTTRGMDPMKHTQQQQHLSPQRPHQYGQRNASAASAVASAVVIVEDESSSPPLPLIKPVAMKIARPQAVRLSQWIPNDDDEVNEKEVKQQPQPEPQQIERQHRHKERRHHRRKRRDSQEEKEEPSSSLQAAARAKVVISSTTNTPSFAPPAGLVRPTPMRMAVPTSTSATTTKFVAPAEPMPPLPPLHSQHHEQQQHHHHTQHQQQQHKVGAVARTQRLFRHVQPFPRDASEHFYHVAHAQHIAGPELHQAIVETQEWHRKWTFQDEEGHTRPQYYNVQASTQRDKEVMYDHDQQHHHHDLLQDARHAAAATAVSNHFLYTQHQAQQQSQQQQNPLHHPMFLELLRREMDGAKNPSPQMSPGSSPPEAGIEEAPTRMMMVAAPTPIRPKAMHASTAAGANNNSSSSSNNNNRLSTSYGSNNNSRNKSQQMHPPLYEDEEQILVVAPTLLNHNRWSRTNRSGRTAKHYSRRRVDESDKNGVDGHQHDNEEEEEDALFHDSKRRATHRTEDLRRSSSSSSHHHHNRHHRMMEDDDEEEDAEHQKNDPQLLFPIRPKVLRPVAMRVALPPPVHHDQDGDEEEDDNDQDMANQQDNPADQFPRYYRRHSSQDNSLFSQSSAVHVPHHVVIDRSASSSPLSLPTIHSGGDFDALTMTEDNMTTPMVAAAMQQRPPEQVHIIEDDDMAQGLPAPQPLVVVDYQQHLQQQQQARSTTPLPPDLQACRDDILQALALSGGEVSDPKFLQALEPLALHYAESQHDTRPFLLESESNRRVEGMWLSLSKPTFFGNLGENDHGDPMYTLGRMAFDMYAPAQLVCSLQGNFNPVSMVPPSAPMSIHSTMDDADDDVSRRAIRDTMPVPKKFQEEVASGSSVLRTYNVVSAITIEPNLAAFPDAPNKDVRRPIKGIMTTYGYTLPDPEVPNRHSVWFTGGRMEPNNDPTDVHEWKRLFSRPEYQKRGWGEQAKLLAAKMLMGATVPTGMADDGSMEYTFTRPLGGHGVAYIDVIYLDDTLRIVRGHRGTVFVFARLPEQESL